MNKELAINYKQYNIVLSSNNLIPVSDYKNSYELSWRTSRSLVGTKTGSVYIPENVQKIIGVKVCCMNRNTKYPTYALENEESELEFNTRNTELNLMALNGTICIKEFNEVSVVGPYNNPYIAHTSTSKDWSEKYSVIYPEFDGICFFKNAITVPDTLTLSMETPKKTLLPEQRMYMSVESFGDKMRLIFNDYHYLSVSDFDEYISISGFTTADPTNVYDMTIIDFVNSIKHTPLYQPDPDTVIDPNYTTNKTIVIDVDISLLTLPDNLQVVVTRMSQPTLYCMSLMYVNDEYKHLNVDSIMKSQALINIRNNKFKTAHILLDSFNRISTGETVSETHFRWLYNSGVSGQQRGVVYSLQHISNIVAIKCSNISFPSRSIDSIVGPTRVITLNLEGTSPLKYNHEKIPFQFIFRSRINYSNYDDDSTERSLWYQLIPLNDGIFRFNHPVGSFSDLIVSFNRPDTIIKLPLASVNVTGLEFSVFGGNQTLIDYYDENVFSSGDLVTIVGFTTTTPEDDKTLIDKMNSPLSHNVVSADSNSFVLDIDISGVTVDVNAKVTIYNETKRILIPLTFYYVEDN